MRKKIFYFIHLAAVLLAVSLVAFSQDDDQSVKIIQFGVGNADCTLIVVKDLDTSNNKRKLFTLINTAGTSANPTTTPKSTSTATPSAGNADNLWREIWTRIQMEGGTQLDYLVISHLDADHVGYAAKFLDIIATKHTAWRKNLIIINRLVFDNTSKTKASKYKLWLPKDSANEYKKKYKQYYSKRKNRDPQRRFLFFGQDLFKINQTYDLKNVQMICVASDGMIGPDQVAKNKGNVVAENDLSFAFVLRFGSFRYFTGGDLGFQGSRYTNMEDPLVKQLETIEWNTLTPFHVCALKVNHHGSDNSTGNEFVRYFNPALAVFSAGQRTFKTKTTSKIHPTAEAIKQLGGNTPGSGNTTPSRQLLFTFRLRLGGSNDANPMKNFNKYKSWALVPPNGAPQDVILYVRKEADERPLNDLPPRIYMSRMWRSKAKLKSEPRPKSAPSPKATEPTPKLPNEFPYDPYFIECDKVDTNKKHKVLILPSLTPLIAPNNLDRISQLWPFFNQQ